MNESYLENIKNNHPTDPVYISQKHAIYSTFNNDVIFGNRNINNPIYCGGFISDFKENVYSLNKNQYVGYISLKQDPTLKISSNLIFKMDNHNKKLISLLPYGSYAMKIIREVKPRIDNNILLIGDNFFSVLLIELLKLSSTNIYTLKAENNNFVFQNHQNKNIEIFEDIHSFNSFFNKDKINNLIVISDVDERLEEYLEKILKFSKIKISIIGFNNMNNIRIRERFSSNLISQYDKGFSDPSYQKGIKYPYSYVRWDYKRNMEYFISLVENGKFMLNFLDLGHKKVNSIEEIYKIIPEIQSESLFLFQIN